MKRCITFALIVVILSAMFFGGVSGWLSAGAYSADSTTCNLCYTYNNNHTYTLEESGMIAVAFNDTGIDHTVTCDGVTFDSILSPYPSTWGSCFYYAHVSAGTYAVTINKIDYGANTSGRGQGAAYMFFPDIASFTTVSTQHLATYTYNFTDSTKSYFFLGCSGTSNGETCPFTITAPMSYAPTFQFIRLMGAVFDASVASTFTVTAPNASNSSGVLLELVHEVPDPEEEENLGILASIRNIASNVTNMPATIVDGIGDGLTAAKDSIVDAVDTVSSSVLSVTARLQLLPGEISSGISGILQSLFVPDDDYFSDAFDRIKGAVEIRLPFTVTLFETIDDVVERLQGATSDAPVIYITYDGRRFKFIDFAVFNDYIVEVRAIILTVIWLAFIFRTVKKIPGIINGTPDDSSVDSTIFGVSNGSSSAKSTH